MRSSSGMDTILNLPFSHVENQQDTCLLLQGYHHNNGITTTMLRTLYMNSNPHSSILVSRLLSSFCIFDIAFCQSGHCTIHSPQLDWKSIDYPISQPQKPWFVSQQVLACALHQPVLASVPPFHAQIPSGYVLGLTCTAARTSTTSSSLRNP